MLGPRGSVRVGSGRVRVFTRAGWVEADLQVCRQGCDMLNLLIHHKVCFKFRPLIVPNGRLVPD